MEPESMCARIRQRSRSTCAFCVAVWQMLESEDVDDRVLGAWSGHLADKHGWVPDEVVESVPVPVAVCCSVDGCALHEGHRGPCYFVKVAFP